MEIRIYPNYRYARGRSNSFDVRFADAVGILAISASRRHRPSARIIRLASIRKETVMAWTTPTLVEICIGLEINGYLPAEF